MTCLLTTGPMSVMLVLSKILRTNGGRESCWLLQRYHLLLLFPLSNYEKAILEMKLDVVKCWVLFLSSVLANKASRRRCSTELEFENQKLVGQWVKGALGTVVAASPPSCLSSPSSDLLGLSRQSFDLSSRTMAFTSRKANYEKSKQEKPKWGQRDSHYIQTDSLQKTSDGAHPLCKKRHREVWDCRVTSEWVL